MKRCERCGHEYPDYESHACDQPAPGGVAVAAGGELSWKFNWAAFLIGPIWLLGHGLWLWVLGYVVAMWLAGLPGNPLLRTGVHLVISVLLGANGNAMLWRTGRYASHWDLTLHERPWTVFAVIVSLVAVVAYIVVLLLLRS